MNNSLTLSQKQVLALTPQMLQSLQLFAMPIMDLQAVIKNEIETNPALEIPNERDISFDSIAAGYHEKGRFDDYSDSSSYGSDNFSQEDADSHQLFMENAISSSETLQEHLEKQLVEATCSDNVERLARLVISNLDKNGFSRTDPWSLIDEKDDEDMEKALDLVHHFDPVGCAAQDWKESLIIQASEKKLDDEDLNLFTRMVGTKLEAMRSGKVETVAKSLKTDVDTMNFLYEFLQTLTPFPGSQYNSGMETYIVPDLSIHNVDGNLQLTMNDASIPDLKISNDFEELMDDAQDRETKKYIKEKLDSARQLIEQISMRNSTLYKVALILLREQNEFFLKGPMYLKPLIQKQVAEELDVHETTISRICSSKYIDSDWGLISVKSLFSSAVGDTSKTAVKEMIREIIEAHEGPKALSDQKISDMLKEKGVSVARRTVSKYRNELNIDTSYVRGS